MASTFVMTCLGLMTLALWIALFIFVIAFFEFRRALQAVEALAYQLMESTERLRNASSRIEDFAQHVRSGWMRAFEIAIGAVQTLWPRGGEPEAHSGSNDKH